MITRPSSALPVRRVASLAQVDNDDRVVLLRLDAPASTPHALRGTAASIWRAIDDQRTADEIIDVLAAAYAISADDVRGDVIACIDGLRDVGLLERNPDHRAV